ncbi:MAG TPA: divergent polysaccharide deacetylase family protein [Gammaproteobacteria bacterium]|nr:divergent polysaccharide deacetylase family protein [Gammaproteobacteria bacterium]
MLRLFAVLGLVLALPAAAQSPVRIAIIIDDLGNNQLLGRQAVELPGPVTYSVLPQRPYSGDIAERAHLGGKEVMLHLPMQASDGRDLGPGGLHTDMSREEFARGVQQNLAAVPHVSGVNNHMGSLLTRDVQAMRWLMEDLRCSGDLYFVDSRTDVGTVARQSAREAGLANAQRDVFLDNEQDADYVREQLQRLIDKARRRGSAIGIGHPHPQTLDVLAEVLPQWAAQGIELVPVSRLVENQGSKRIWHACSSPWPTVAKNSRL